MLFVSFWCKSRFVVSYHFVVSCYLCFLVFVVVVVGLIVSFALVKVFSRDRQTKNAAIPTAIDSSQGS